MPAAAYHPLVRTIAQALRRQCNPPESPQSPEHPLSTRASESSQTANISKQPIHLMVAVSGGADSVALLRALHHLSHRRTWKLKLAVAHVDHSLRQDSAADAAFVADLADQLHLPHLSRRLEMSPGTANLEAVARRLRYAALADMARQVGATHLAAAHHADDQLETLLMALLRGTTVRGLRGIAWHRPLTPDLTLIRPMLAATHAQAIDYLHTINQPWREDHTNADVRRTRARLRHEVLPVLRQINPAAAHNALKLSEHARRLIPRK